MLQKSFPLSLVCCLTFLLLLSACGNHNDQNSQQLPENLSSYVYAFTSGSISRTSPVRIQFSRAVVDPSAEGETAEDGLIKFKPALEGLAIWEDAQTLRFTPSTPMASGTTYKTSVQLKDLFDDVPKELRTFDFEFRTKDQYFDITFMGLQAPDPSKLSQQEFQGKLITADLADAESVEKLLTANQKGKSLPIRWSHVQDGMVHEFTIENISRGNSASNIEISWNGNPLSVDLKGNRSFEVPALGDFKVTDAKIIPGSEQYVLLTFSDPLKANQSLDGLVSISNYSGNYRFLIDGTQLHIYPANRIVGERKIRVESGIRNIADSRMDKASEWFINFEDVKPQIRLVGNGVVMPNSDGLIFPFEAVSLTAVEVEVFKIFNNNILQYLQSNNLDGDYDLYRVGRIIMQKRINLSDLNAGAQTSAWTRYALDLSTLIDQDPDAIYQIRIGFRPEYSTYFCEGQSNNNTGNLTLAEEASEGSGGMESILDGWYGINGYYEGYDWRDRENPCMPAYFNSERFVRRNVIASNFGMIAKGGKDGSYFVVLTDLRTTEPVSGAKLEFYDYQQQLLGTATTNSDGIAEAKFTKEEPFVVVAKQGDQKGYLKVQDGNSLSLSRFDVSGVVTQKGIKGFMYAERGVWRPGDSVFLNFILEDKTASLPGNYPINFELYDARGQLYTQRATATNVNNVYPLHFKTNAEDVTGDWRATVKAGGATFTKTIKVETVKPNRLKIDLDLPEELRSENNPISVPLAVNWLHGAPAGNLKAVVEVQIDQTNTTFASYGDFEFDDPARSLTSEPRVLYQGQLNSDGKTTVTGQLTNSNTLPGKLRARFKTRVFEKGGDFSTDNVSVPFSPYQVYTGVELPKTDYGENRIDMNKEERLNFVAVDADGKAVRNKKLSVGLYRVNWRWWWDRGYDNVSRYNSSSHYDAIETSSIVTNDKGQANWSVRVNDWGRYLVRVCDTEGGHCSGDFFYAGYPWYEDGDNSAARQAAAMLSFSSDKEKYEVGQTVQLKIPTGEEGRAMVTVENGTKVIQSFWAKASKGENTFTFKVTEAMTPTVYAHVALIQPHAQAKNDLPIRMYGVIPINVEDPNTRLAPELSMPDELKPEETVTVTVKEKDGKPMAYTIAMVDEGLLSLTRFKTPNPWDAFYAREALGVKSWDVYDDVLGAYGGELQRILSIGGDAAVEVNPEDQQANRFKPVVRHLGPFYLGKGKSAKHKITLPNYVGAVRTMVVAANKGAYGSTEKTTPVRQPLMVLATLPRVLGPGEQVQLPVSVFAMDNSVKNVSVKVEETSGLASIAGGSSKSVTFSKTGDKLVTFDIDVKSYVGVARFVVSAQSGSHKAKHEIELQVRNPNPYVTRVRSGIIQPGASWSESYEAIGMPGTNQGVLEVSSIPPINLGERLDYLIRYPYGCLEQTLSGGFPQLYVGKLLDLDDEQKQQATKNIQATIDRLKLFQLATGGFAYWPGNTTVNQWSSCYAGHFLLEAKALGYTVPSGMLDNWIQFQKKISRMWDPDYEKYGFYSARSNELTQAYRLYTLARAKEPDFASMNRLREQKSLNPVAKWRLAAAYAEAGKPEVAAALLKNVSKDVPAYTEMSYTYGSDLRDKAMILETLLALERENEAAEMVKSIADQLNGQPWWSTQTVAYSLLAIGKYVGDTDIKEPIAFSASIAGQQQKNTGGSTPIIQMDVPIDEVSNKSVNLKNTGKKVLFANLILQGQPLIGQEEDESNNLKISVSYKGLDGSTIDPGAIPQGTDFIAAVTISHPGTRPNYYREMALDQIFPSGWEILNTRMDNVQNFKQTDRADYQDFRDDRVYTFFDLPVNKQHTYYVQLNAAYQGRFYLPAVSCGAMYDNTISASRAGQWVEVTTPKSI